MAKKKIDFAKSFEELETIVEKMEGGDLDLESGVKEYEKGLALVEDLEKKLKEVENTVTVLREKMAENDEE